MQGELGSVLPLSLHYCRAHGSYITKQVKQRLNLALGTCSSRDMEGNPLFSGLFLKQCTVFIVLKLNEVFRSV